MDKLNTLCLMWRTDPYLRHIFMTLFDIILIYYYAKWFAMQVAMQIFFVPIFLFFFSFLHLNYLRTVFNGHV